MTIPSTTRLQMSLKSEEYTDFQNVGKLCIVLALLSKFNN